ncbi:hypothetical protein KS4_02780 [Poriferisphaera corsica]|uniref:Uncharacterized protein n=1 Tax=Poriferisphaera corsica TaxID=2528020 RepID=A0A517YPT9_9BACT|nr:hypothetical protein KS4_02780 [Poriferisphaera corsica]
MTEATLALNRLAHKWLSAGLARILHTKGVSMREMVVLEVKVRFFPVLRVEYLVKIDA